MTAQMSLGKKTSPWLATTTAALLALSGLAVVPAANAAEPAPAALTWSFNKGYSQVAPGTASGAATLADGEVFRPSTGTTIPRKIASWGEGDVNVDTTTHATEVQYHGAVTMEGSGGPARVTVTITDPKLVIDSDDSGRIRAGVSWAAPNLVGSTEGPVTLVSFAPGSWNGQTFTGTPKWDGAVAPGSYADLGVDAAQPIEGKSWDAELVRALPSSVRAFFYKSGTTASQEDKAPSTFTAAVPATVDATVTAASSAGLTVSVNASGLRNGATAGYGALIERGTEGSLTDPSSPTAAVAQIAIADGSSSFSLVAPKSKLDPAKQYSVVIWKNHSAATPENIYAIADVDVTPAQWGEVFSPTTTNLKLASTSVAYNAATSATVTVSSEAGTPTGTATLKVAGQTSVVELVGGTATVKLSKLLKVGSYPATVAFANSGTGTLFGASSATATVKVVKATPKVSAKLAKKSVSAKKNARLNVAVSIPGTLGAKAAKYKVQVFDGKKKLKTVALSSTGKAGVKLPKLKRGTHKLKVVVLATANTNAKSSSAIKLKVTR